MQDDPSRNQERLTRVHADALSGDVARMLRLAAEPVQSGELVIEQIRRAARRCGLSFGRAKKLWYQECKVSGVDFVSITSAIARSNDNLIAYQNAKAALLRERMADAEVRV